MSAYVYTLQVCRGSDPSEEQYTGALQSLSVGIVGAGFRRVSLWPGGNPVHLSVTAGGSACRHWDPSLYLMVA